MNRTADSRFQSPDLHQLVRSFAELFQEGVAEVSAMGREERNRETVWEENKNPGTLLLNETCLPRYSNPFVGSVVFFSRPTSKLTILLSMGKPLRVIAEIYGHNGRFIKRLFDRKIEPGLTEITGLGIRPRKGAFVVLLNSVEGMKYYRIKDH